ELRPRHPGRVCPKRPLDTLSRRDTSTVQLHPERGSSGGIRCTAISPEEGEDLSMGSDINRRDLIKRAAAVGLVTAPAAAFLTSCASGGGGKDKAKEGKKSADNPFGVAEDAPLDVVIFKGGYGDDYA